ncbi:MAG: hypothetical protein HOV79_00285 [Hamadaea sp.]|nr:hypothetical protein [Hamadaea sp.]
MSDLSILRRLLAHARNHGWEHQITICEGLKQEHTWKHSNRIVSLWGYQLQLLVDDDTVCEAYPATARQAADLLVALEFVPVEYSSAYTARRTTRTAWAGA